MSSKLIPALSSEYLLLVKSTSNQSSKRIPEPLAGPSTQKSSTSPKLSVPKIVLPKAVHIVESSSSSTTLSTLTDSESNSDEAKIRNVTKHKVKRKKQQPSSKNIKNPSEPKPKVQSSTTGQNPYTEIENPGINSILKTFPIPGNISAVDHIIGQKETGIKSSVFRLYDKKHPFENQPLQQSKKASFPLNNDHHHNHGHHNHHSHSRRRDSENESVQTAHGNIHEENGNKLEHWECETPLSRYWQINPPDDPKMALISLLVETHRRIILSMEHPNLAVRNTIDYGISSLQVKHEIDPDCVGCVWPFVNPEDLPKNSDNNPTYPQYYFLADGSDACDWDDQDFTSPLCYLTERRKKLKELILIMKEELFYLTERFVELSKQLRHKIVRSPKLRKRFESVGLDLVYKRAQLDNMHHLYHRLKKLYDAYLPFYCET